MPNKKYIEIEEITTLLRNTNLFGGDGGKDDWGNRNNYEI